MSYKISENYRLYENYDKNLTSKLESRLKESPVTPAFSQNAISILERRYFAKNEDGVPQEDVKGLMSRVAANVAYPDFHYGNEEAMWQTAQQFYRVMMSREFMPNSPTLMNAGRKMQQLAACFVLPVHDNMDSIFGGVTETAQVHKTGGGTGFFFGNLRRKNDFVSSTYGKASGPVSYFGVYNAATHSVNQGGFRRGANMGMMPHDHPDTFLFIHAKEDPTDRTYYAFNFSVSVTDEFMQAVKDKGYYVVRNPRNGKIHDLTIKDIKRDELSVKTGLIKENDRVLVVDEQGQVIYQNPVEFDSRGEIARVTKKVVGKVDENGRIMYHAPTIFREIAEIAHKSGEPGVIFVDRLNEFNPTHPKYFKGQGKLPIGVGLFDSTNPCGEQPLLSYEACNLGSINLGLFVREGKIDYNRLGEVVDISVKFLDNVIDMSKGPLEQIIETVHSNRKIGLGVMGFADMLIKLKIPYNSEQARTVANEVMKFIRERGIRQSEDLAEQRGVFPNFEHSMYANDKPRRNATITTQAPTGTISIIAGASGGLESIFDVVYTHKDADGTVRYFINEDLSVQLREKGIDPDRVLKDLSDKESKRRLPDLNYVPDEIKKIFVGAKDIAVEDHVLMQAEFQKYVDNAVSKTINMPKGANIDDVIKAYNLAFEKKCKGITVYVDESREDQVLSSGTTAGKKDLETLVYAISPKKRPDRLEGVTVRKRTGCGNLFITLNYDTNNIGYEGNIMGREKGTEQKKDLFEVFATMGKAGGCASCQNEANGRLISFLLRSHSDPLEISTQLIGIRCHKPYGLPGPKAIYSCADAIGRAIAESCGIKVNGEIGDSEDFDDLVSKQKKEKANLSPKVHELVNSIIQKDPTIAGGACPECGSTMVHAEGCIGGKCSNDACGYAECG